MAASTTFSPAARGSLVALLAICGALAVGGCGDSDDDTTGRPAAVETSVRAVLSDLQAAAVAGDGKRICTEIFTPKLAKSVTTSAKSGSCAEEVRRNLFSPTTRLTVQGVTVADDANANAKVKEASGAVSTVFLVRQSGRWRIRSVQPA
ncbi:MAG: hypothetical protein ACRDLN_04220 [Solirubrobacteraceae bacterium]